MLVRALCLCVFIYMFVAIFKLVAVSHFSCSDLRSVLKLPSGAAQRLHPWLPRVFTVGSVGVDSVTRLSTAWSAPVESIGLVGGEALRIQLNSRLGGRLRWSR